MEAISCPKCRSVSTYVVQSRHPWLIGQTDETFVCKVCGTRVYGTQKVAELRSAHQLATMKRQEAEARAAAEAKAAAEREAIRLAALAAEKVRQTAAEAAAHAAKVAKLKKEAAKVQLLQAAKCAWPSCTNDHTTVSKYCSRNCSNKHARARHKERQDSKKLLGASN